MSHGRRKVKCIEETPGGTLVLNSETQEEEEEEEEEREGRKRGVRKEVTHVPTHALLTHTHTHLNIDTVIRIKELLSLCFNVRPE